MTMNTSTLRPGLLVSMKSSVSGNVTYIRKDIDSQLTEAGAATAKWETERTVADLAEHELAVKTRTRARLAVVRLCAQSAFGLLCPESAAAELEKGIAEARRITEEFNATAKLTRVTIYVITGRIAADDVEAMRAINSELTDLLTTMEDGVRNLDVKAIREAANKAKSMGAMLSPEAATRVAMAVEAARGAARRINQAGEQAAAEIDTRAIRTITESRTAFLDMDGSRDVAAPAAQARTLDLTPAMEVKDGAGGRQNRRAVEL